MASGASNVYDPGDGSPLALRIVNRDGSAISAGGGGGVSIVDDAAFTVAASSLTVSGGIVTSDSVDAGDAGAFAMLANRQQKITLYDSSGAEITSFGGGTQYTEDAASAANPVGGMLILRRRDTLNASEVSADGDNIAASSTSKGELNVKHADSIAVTGTFWQATQPVSGTVAATQSGTWTVQPGNTANTTAWKVDGSAVTQPVSGTVSVNTHDVGAITTSITPGTSAAHLGKAEDGAHASGDTGVMALGVRTDSTAARSGTDGDYEPFQLKTGRLVVDASGVAVPITDNNGSITVDGTVGVSGTVTVDSELTTADLDTGAGTDTRAVVGLVGAASGGGALIPGDATKGLKVQITDGSGNQITSFGGGVEFAEDSAHSSGDTGKLVLAVRRDANTTLVDTTGDYAPLQVDASGSLKVAITAGAGSGGTSIADDAAFTVATTSLTPVGGVYAGTLDSVDDGDAGAFHMTIKRALHVNLRDASGNEVSVGGGTQYDEDAASAGAEKLTLAGAVRRDTAASSSGTDGDYSTLNTDASGRLWVNVGTGTVAATQSGTWNVGTVSTITNVVHVDDNSGSLTVDGTVTANAGTNLNTSALALESGGNLATLAGAVRAEDVASADGHTGVVVMATRKATPANTSGTDGDYEMLQMSAGRLWTSSTIDAALPAGTNAIGKLAANSGVDIGDVDVLTVPTDPFGANADAASATGSISAKLRFIASTGIPITGTVTVGSHAVTAAGDVAHDGGDSGNPVKIGARARSSEIAAVANNDRSDLITDLVGKLIVLPYANPENFVSGAITTAMTGTTSTSLIAAPGAGLRNYITQITVSNAHATVGTDIIIQDGSGGTTLYTIPAAAVYGGATLTFPVPLRQPTANTALFCANVTTGASTKASASGFKGA